MAEYGSTNVAGIEKSLDKLLEIADKQLKSALILERQTNTLIRLTRWLIGLTVVLIFFGVIDVVEVIFKFAESLCQSH